MPPQPVKPKKSLGQNFLSDSNIARKIASQLKPSEDDIVFEIGPGMGALTQVLLESKAILHCFEIDLQAIEFLNEKFPESIRNCLFINRKDILELDFEKYITENNITRKIKVIGNIPYNISSQILFLILENKDYIEKAILTVQKEVALRLTAPTHTKEYGITTVAVNLLGKVRRKFDIPPSCFYPKPKIMSTVIEISFKLDSIDTDTFFNIMKLIRAGFNQRRKKLSNSLENYFRENIKFEIREFIAHSKQIGFDWFSKRAEQLTETEYLKLFKLINEYRTKKIRYEIE